MDVLIVGAGLFGSMAADLCERMGCNVTVFDDRRPMAGSPPAACLMRPSWMTMLSKDFLTKAYDVLETLYGVKAKQFSTPAGQVEVHWVDPAKVLRTRWCTMETVREVGDGYIVTDKGRYEGKVLVAAGVWSGELVKCPEIRALTGAAFRFNKPCPEPKITVWAPYRQAVSFEITKGVTWFGDGTAILHKNWNEDERIAASLIRARKHGLPKTKLVEQRVGMRPYIKGHKKGYFRKVHPNTWLVTGGAKNGTVMAAYYAQKFVRAIL